MQSPSLFTLWLPGPHADTLLIIMALKYQLISQIGVLLDRDRAQMACLEPTIFLDCYMHNFFNANKRPDWIQVHPGLERGWI